LTLALLEKSVTIIGKLGTMPCTVTLGQCGTFGAFSR
jgi:hypothetical protein